MSWLFTSGVQSIEASTSASVLPMNIKGWFPLGLADLISLLSKGLSRVFSNTTVWKHQPFLYGLTLTFIHDYWKKIKALTIWTFFGKVMSLLFYTLSRFIVAFLPRSKGLLISWLQSLCSDFGVQENSLSLFLFFPIYLPWSDGTGCHDLSFLNVEF